jgi:hypothetical protein
MKNAEVKKLIAAISNAAEECAEKMTAVLEKQVMFGKLLVLSPIRSGGYEIVVRPISKRAGGKRQKIVVKYPDGKMETYESAKSACDKLYIDVGADSAVRVLSRHIPSLAEEGYTVEFVD